MRRLLFTVAALLVGCNAGLAQVSTMGATAMRLPTIPATIVSYPLYGPGPFSATTLPGVPGTTLAPVPLASNPTVLGTVVTCATPIAQITPGTQAVSVMPPSSPPLVTLLAQLSSTVATPPLSMSLPAMTSATPLGTILTPIVVTPPGNVSPTPPPGTPSTIACSSRPGGPPTNPPPLPLSPPEIPLNPPPRPLPQPLTTRR